MNNRHSSAVAVFENQLLCYVNLVTHRVGIAAWSARTLFTIDICRQYEQNLSSQLEIEIAFYN